MTRRRRRLFTNETAATGGVMYTDEGELEFDEDEMLCITVLCCANNQMQKMFQRKLYNNYVFCVVYCLLCCVLFVVYQSTVLCQQSNANLFNKI